MNSHSYIGIGSVIVFAVLFILYKKSIPHKIILLSRLVHFKSGAAAISPEKRVFQAAAGIRSRGRRSDCRFQRQAALIYPHLRATFSSAELTAIRGRIPPNPVINGDAIPSYA